VAYARSILNALLCIFLVYFYIFIMIQKFLKGVKNKTKKLSKYRAKICKYIGSVNR